MDIIMGKRGKDEQANEKYKDLNEYKFEIAFRFEHSLTLFLNLLEKVLAHFCHH